MRICLVSCAKGASATLREWFEYHRGVGATHFYLVDHQPSEDDTSEIIASQVAQHPDSVRSRIKTGLFYEEEWICELCNWAIDEAGNDETLLLINDTDEFVGPNSDTNSFLDQVKRCFSHVQFASSVAAAPAHMKPSSHRSLLIVSPLCFVAPQSADPAWDWRQDSAHEPSPLSFGKSALFIGPCVGPNLRVVPGGWNQKGYCHAIATTPPTPIASCPEGGGSHYVWPLPEDIYPFQVVHHFHTGAESMMRKLRQCVSSGLATYAWHRYAAYLPEVYKYGNGDQAAFEKWLKEPDAATVVKLYAACVHPILRGANRVLELGMSFPPTHVAKFYGCEREYDPGRAKSEFELGNEKKPRDYEDPYSLY